MYHSLPLSLLSLTSLPLHTHLHTLTPALICSHIPHTTLTHTTLITLTSVLRISLSLQTSKCQISGDSFVTNIREVGVNFDQHRIITLEQVVERFPHSSEQLLTQRKKVGGDRMTRKENPIV